MWLTVATADLEKAEVLNNYFSSVFTHENLDLIPVFNDLYHGEPLDNFDITTDQVYQRLRELKSNKSPGPDGLHPRILKGAASAICVPLTIIFKKSICTAIIPDDWKTANVVPIYKKGDRNQPGNYRPVSLTSVVVKLLEALIREFLMNHFTKNHLFADEQHGFLPN